MKAVEEELSKMQVFQELATIMFHKHKEEFVFKTIFLLNKIFKHFPISMLLY
jgi:hypothetical protein